MKVAVVGLGIAGLSICTTLAEKGVEVSGFEQFDFMHDRGSSHGDTRIFRRTPGEGDLYVRMAERAQELWRAWEKRAGKRLLSAMPGVMAGPPGSAFIASCRALSQHYRHPAVFLEGKDVENATQGAIKLPGDWSVCLQRDCGVLHADEARLFLIAEAERLGAKLHANVSIASPIEAASLVVDGVKRSFDAVIVSAGGWSGRLLPELAPALKPKRRVVGWFRSRSPLHALPPVLCCDNEIGLYGMPAPGPEFGGGLYKIGAHVVGGEVDPDCVEEPNEDDAALISAQIAEHFPLHDPTPVTMKRCIYTMTADENFLIAPIRQFGEDRVLAFSCCSGHGFKYAPLYGDIALAWLNGEECEELKAFGVENRPAHATKLGGA
jgi:sarcosine oxidase